MSNQLWSAEKSRKIVERIVVEGDLILQSPTHFGTGDSDEVTDMPLLVDGYDGQTPLLPGSSLAGALRNYLHECLDGYRSSESAPAVTRLFGGVRSTSSGGEQSLLIVADAFGQLPQTATGQSVLPEIRTTVRIDDKTRTAADGALFNMQLWPAGTTFPLRFELNVRAHDDATQLKQSLALALSGLGNSTNDGEITIGARKQRGYGQLRVENWRVATYDMTQANGSDLLLWLQQGNTRLSSQAHATVAAALGVTPTNKRATSFTLKTTVALDGSLLIRDGAPAVYAGADGQIMLGPDMVHLHAHDVTTGKRAPVLPGTSVAGALRARASRIVQLLADSDAAHTTGLIDELFGSDLSNKSTNQASSLLRISEQTITDATTNLVQDRVAIDRFTGGAKDTALFNEQPVFAKPETQINLTWRLLKRADASAQQYEAHVGLLLLLLKDLWTGFLPLGGESSVGRGRVRGVSAQFVMDEIEYTVEQAEAGITISPDASAQQLNTYVKQLKNYINSPKKQEVASS